MSIKIVDLKAMADEKGKQRTLLMNGPRMNTWLTVYEPGESDELHCHNADQTFYMVEGECTVRFPDGAQFVMKPGCVALMPGGNFYQLINASQEKMVLLGTRASSQEKGLTIDYVTRKPVDRGQGVRPEPTGTRIHV